MSEIMKRSSRSGCIARSASAVASFAHILTQGPTKVS